MTVSAELAKRHQRMEYILAIEGIGWPTDENDLSSGFDGDVFVVDDLDGTLASDLGCTIHHGLSWSGTVGDSLDVVTGQYSQGQLTFEIQDVDGWLEDNFRPLLEGNTQEVYAEIQWGDTNIDIDDGTDLDEGDVVWIGGQEAIKLGTKAAVGGGAPATAYRYTLSTRGYLGTHRGMPRGAVQSSDGFPWPAETSVYDWCRFYHNRNADLFMHVPGEAVANCQRVWSGKLRGATREISGNNWTMASVSDLVRDQERMWNAVDMQVEDALYRQVRPNSGVAQSHDGMPMATPKDFGHLVRLRNTQRDRYTEKLVNKYAIAEGYRYRTEPGGTDGMRTAWDAGNIQALTTTVGDANTIMRFMQLGQRVFLCKRAANSTHIESDDYRTVELEPFSSMGHNDAVAYGENGHAFQEAFEVGTECRWLLDNWHDSWEINWFAYNKLVTRNPIDVLLTFLTSRDYEYKRLDTHAATPGTATVLVFASSVGSTNLWAGAALHCVEGNNKGEARVIASNTGTTITVDEAFSNTPGTSEEYQIRNSVYDTLPVGWGLGVPWGRIDIDAFEDLRDLYFCDAEVGRFVLGTQDRLDLLKMLQEYICGPYGFYLTIDRSNGKLTPRYIGLAQGDGIIEDYVAVAESDFLDIGDINYNLEKPVARVWLKLRLMEEKLIGARAVGSHQYWGPNTGDSSAPRATLGEVRAMVPGTMGGETYDLPVAQGELHAFANNGVDELTLEALFNTTAEDKTWLINRANMIAKFFSVPPPTVPITLDGSFILTVSAGTILSMTKTGVANPFATSKGWTDVVGVVVSSNIVNPLTKPALECTVMLLQDLSAGRVAPSVLLAGAKVGSDGTSDYFVVSPKTYTVRSDAKDYYGFAVGDIINLFDKPGAEYAGAESGPYTISGFGANNASSPADASTDIIRIEEDIDEAVLAAAIDTTYWLSFDDWSASNTARMEEYAAYATAAGALSGGDGARTYS